ncbi:MAG TPA: C4-type zinc ribbon domain-containing protein [Acidimicrobiales bacterium]|nr:C4-type zinc ribbon domain-containing protein [Acidimicrobiales bacterium]
MSGPALERLMTVQDLDTTITQLQHKRAALVERSGLAAAEAELDDLVAQQRAADARRTGLAQAQKGLEEQIAAVSERRGTVEQRMYAARGSSARDLQAMNDEVRHLAERLSELEEQELVVMVDLDPVDAELARLAARRAPVEEKALALRAEVAGEQSTIDVELSSATATRAAEAALLPVPLAERYEFLRARMKGMGAARLIGSHCSGCHLELSSVEVERIRSQPDDTVTTCEQCGRILVPA